MDLALPTGFEPVIFRVRDGRPGPLDDGSISLFSPSNEEAKIIMAPAVRFERTFLR